MGLVAVTLFLGYDTDVELVARSKLLDVLHSYNNRVIGTFDSVGRLSLSRDEARMCVAQMQAAKEELEGMKSQYSSTFAAQSLQTRFLAARISNRLEECEHLAAQLEARDQLASPKTPPP